jgi:hypothetical protein
MLDSAVELKDLASLPRTGSKRSKVIAEVNIAFALMTSGEFASSGPDPGLKWWRLSIIASSCEKPYE